MREPHDATAGAGNEQVTQPKDAAQGRILFALHSLIGAVERWQLFQGRRERIPVPPMLAYPEAPHPTNSSPSPTTSSLVPQLIAASPSHWRTLSPKHHAPPDPSPMSAVPRERLAVPPIDMTAGNGLEAPHSAVSSAIRARPLLAILTVFWIYVTLSNTVYALGMQHFMDVTLKAHIFSAWDTRVLQHVLLYPLLLGSVWLSLRIGWQRPWRTWGLQLALGIFFSALASPLLMAAQKILGQHDDHYPEKPHTFTSFWQGPEPALWLSSVTTFLLTYSFCLALVAGFNFYQRYRDSQLRVAALERAWSTARLATLRMQLSPHTLFNLLHTIRGQISWDPQKAQAMVVQLGDLLRRLLSAGERDFSRLSDELHFTYSYLELQRQRFPDRLTLHFPEVEILPSVWVPSLILQPLVENAVVHGLSGHEGPVSIRIEIDSEDAHQLVVRIINTVAPSRPVGREGVGLRNVRERLAVQFAEKASFEASPAANGDWVATVRIPLLRDGPTPNTPPARDPLA